MVYSEISLRTLSLCVRTKIKSTAQFWRDYGDRASFESAAYAKEAESEVDVLRAELDKPKWNGCSMVCAFDGNFPPVNSACKQSDRPFLLFYKGDISLLSDLCDNVAVIGTTTPTEEIEERERKMVSRLAESGACVVSGLAAGCDGLAHGVCVGAGAKTIAVLPSPLDRIYPQSNRGLAEKIAESGGLLVTEYFTQPETRSEAIDRFIQRDRLQALYSKAVVMIASYSVGRGGSGSRHAMEFAGKLLLPRFVMYRDGDAGDKRFGLNADYLKAKKAEAADETKVSLISALPAPKTEDVLARPKQLKIF